MSYIYDISNLRVNIIVRIVRTMMMMTMMTTVKMIKVVNTFISQRDNK
jgi:hypothetical protein